MSTLRDVIRQTFPDLDDRPPRFAAALGVNVETVNRWFRTDRIPADQAEQLVALSSGRLTMRQLAPFVAPAPTPTAAAAYTRGPLWRIVSGACPELRDSVIVAAALKISPSAARTYFEKSCIPYGPARQLVEWSGGRLRFDRLQQYIAEPPKRGPRKRAPYFNPHTTAP